MATYTAMTTDFGGTICGPCLLRKFTLEPVTSCAASVMHKHNYDHTVLCFRGRISLCIVGKEPVILQEGETFAVLAGFDHVVKAIDGPATFFCMFPHRDKEGIAVERYDAGVCDPAAYDFAER